MIRAYTYKLYKNQKIERKFHRWLGICRYVYNAAKETKEESYRCGLKLSAYDLSNQLTRCKKEDELSFLKEISAVTLQGVIERMDNSFKRFFKGAGYPKWAKKGLFKSFGFKQGTIHSKGGSLRQTGKGFRLPKFGTVRVFNNRKINGKIKTASLIKKSDGIYLRVVAEVEDITYSPNENQIGLDMGITHFLTTSEGCHIENPRFLEKQLKRLRIEQRKLSRAKKGSNRRKKQRDVVVRLHKKVTDARSDFLHKHSTTIAKAYGNVAIEDLNISKMIKNNHLARHISDVSWGTFFEMLNYKCNNLVKVNPAYSSQECSKCGHIMKENRPNQKQFKCISCHHVDNADVNGAKNIMARAFVNSR